MIEQIEELSKQLHQLAEMFDISCKHGNSFEAFETIGKISQLLGELRHVAKMSYKDGETFRKEQQEQMRKMFQNERK